MSINLIWLPLAAFKEQALQLEANKRIKTPEQQVFLHYLKACRARIIPNATPQDVPPSYTKRTCTYPGCKRIFTRLSYMKSHLKRHYDTSRILWTYPGCKETFTSMRSMKAHLKLQHIWV
ncbi:hypothetical protein MBANPS3_008493 [Mucor bainieri]